MGRCLALGVLGACGSALALPLVMYAYTGWFSRYASDDYCTAGMVIERGFAGAQAYWYASWSGRFTFTALVSALELIGVGTTQVIPALALVAAVAAGTWTLAPLAERSRWAHPKLVSMVLAELLVVAVCASAPNLGQSLFWQTGVLTYALPLIVYVLFVGWTVRRLQAGASSRAGLGSAALMFAAGGLSETTLAVQAAGLVLALAATVLWTRGRTRATLLTILGGGLLGTLAAGAMLGLAPGNGARLSQERDPGASVHALPLAARASLNLMVGFSRRFEAELRPVFLMTFLGPAALGAWISWRQADSTPWLAESVRGVRRLGLVLVAALVLLFATMFPSYLVLGFDPPARIELVSQFILVCGVAAIGFTFGRIIGRAPRTQTRMSRVSLAPALAAVVALGFAAVPLGLASAQVAQAADAQRYAMVWDANDQLLRAPSAQGQPEVVVPALPPRWGWDWVGPKPTDFPNTCVARYYGLDGALRSAS